MSKYLQLALAMVKTRGDFSKGFYRVKNAINNFVVETEEDKNVCNEIMEILNNKDIQDGRVFRDCQYNYSYIHQAILSEKEKLEYSKSLREYYDEF